MMRMTCPAVLLALATAAFATQPASAAPAAWMLNGKTFAEDGITTTAVKTTAKLDRAAEFSGPSLTIRCTGDGEITSPTIHEKDLSSAGSLIISGCRSVTSGCEVPPTIGTVPLSLEGTLDGALATKGIIKPTAGTVFTTLRVEGEGCAAAGNKVVTGDLEMLSPEGQDERTDQLEEVNQAANGLLRVGGSNVSATGAVLVLLANNRSWSFL